MAITVSRAVVGSTTHHPIRANEDSVQTAVTILEKARMKTKKAKGMGNLLTISHLRMEQNSQCSLAHSTSTIRPSIVQPTENIELVLGLGSRIFSVSGMSFSSSGGK